jgi:hypothetical protein
MKKIFQFFLMFSFGVLTTGCFGPGWWDGGKYNGDSPKGKKIESVPPEVLNTIVAGIQSVR